jgi:Caspase domain
VLVLFAGGLVGSPFGNSPRSGTKLLRATRADAVPPATLPSAYSAALADLIGASPATGAAVNVAATAPAPEVAPAPPPPPAPPVDRPIVAPASFSVRPSRSARPLRAISIPPGGREGGVWAVVIGIDDYPGTEGDLRAAKADARDVDAALAAYGVPGNRRVLLLDQEATAANIRASLTWLVAHAAPEATAVFFYSGHVREVSGDPDRDGEAVDEAMVGSDGQHVYDGEMADILRGLEARSMWIGIAACYGGGFDDALAPGRVLTAAAAETDLAYENSALGHSYMVEYMVRRAMLQGKAAASVQDSFAWARAQIAHDYPNRQPVEIDRSRGPVMLGRNVASGPAQPSKSQPQPDRPEPGSEPQPPASPPSATPEPSNPPNGSCTRVLGVKVCSDGDSD